MQRASLNIHKLLQEDDNLISSANSELMKGVREGQRLPSSRPRLRPRFPSSSLGGMLSVGVSDVTVVLELSVKFESEDETRTLCQRRDEHDHFSRFELQRATLEGILWLSRPCAPIVYV